jgi:DNA (cytosine-5)-methyltransferase 1
MVMEPKPVYCLQGNGIDRADTAGCNGKGWKEDSSYTLNTIDRPAVAYATDVGFFNSLENQSPTLLARSYKDPRLVTYPEDTVRYIVRRLTPTECARLQGFSDRWGDIEWISEDAKGEEPHFWREVYMTDCAIKGKKPKPRIAEMQNGWETAVIRWHNQLHTDAAEYKLWGNGIALPCALYVMQGIAGVLNG